MDVSASERDLDGERSTNVYVRDQWDCASWKRSPTLDQVASEFWASCRRVQARTGLTPPPPLPESAPRPDIRPPNCTLSTPSRNTQNMRLYSNFLSMHAVKGFITRMWLHVYMYLYAYMYKFVQITYMVSLCQCCTVFVWMVRLSAI